MPNRFQLGFLASFALVFSALLLTSNFIRAKLTQAGYDPAQLILLGLPKHDDDGPFRPPSAFLTSRVSMLSQLLALLLAAGTSLFVYWKFNSSTRVPPSTQSRTDLTSRTQACLGLEAMAGVSTRQEGRRLPKHCSVSRRRCFFVSVVSYTLPQLPLQAAPSRGRLGSAHRPTHYPRS